MQFPIIVEVKETKFAKPVYYLVLSDVNTREVQTTLYADDKGQAVTDMRYWRNYCKKIQVNLPVKSELIKYKPFSFTAYGVHFYSLKNYYMQPPMIGLSPEAFLRYYEAHTKPTLK